MKKALLVALVIIVVMTGLPVLMGMGSMATCTQCGPGLPGPAPCLPAVLAAGLVAFALLAGSRVGGRARSLSPWLLTRPFERPPQLV